MSDRSNATSIDAYIAEFPAETQKVLHEMRAVIRSAAPGATEKISYAIPTFDLNGNLVHFAGFQHHVGLYPGPSGIAAFEAELTAYKKAKGSVQFPLGQPLPAVLIRRIVEFRVAENQNKLPENLASPARRALAQAGYDRLDQLAGALASDLLKLHGMGPKAISQLRDALAARGLSLAAEGDA